MEILTKIAAQSVDGYLFYRTRCYRGRLYHWHGAAADSWFSHLAFGVPGEDAFTEWLEPVSDEEYDKIK